MNASSAVERFSYTQVVVHIQIVTFQLNRITEADYARACEELCEPESHSSLRLSSQEDQNSCVKYVALLRGVNVGGKNLVSMAELRAHLEQVGLKNVSTYIQSGNVLFESRRQNPLQLSGIIEGTLTEKFGFALLAVVVTEDQLEQVIKQAPPAFGATPAEYRYDVAFLKPPIAAQEVLSTIRLKEGVDLAFEANNVLYFQRLNDRASQSYLPKIINHPAYKNMTIRNWKTTTELHRLIRCKENIIDKKHR